MILQALVQYYEDLLANDKITRRLDKCKSQLGFGTG